jgi:hypothetical protein
MFGDRITVISRGEETLFRCLQCLLALALLTFPPGGCSCGVVHRAALLGGFLTCMGTAHLLRPLAGSMASLQGNLIVPWLLISAGGESKNPQDAVFD